MRPACDVNNRGPRTPAKNPVGGASKNKKIRDRVDSEGKYGRWKLRVMGS